MFYFLFSLKFLGRKTGLKIDLFKPIFLLILFFFYYFTTATVWGDPRKEVLTLKIVESQNSFFFLHNNIYN